MLNYQVLTERLLQIKQNIWFLKMSWRKLKIFASSYFGGKSHFEGDVTQIIEYFIQWLDI